MHSIDYDGQTHRGTLTVTDSTGLSASAYCYAYTYRCQEATVFGEPDPW